MKLLVTGGRDYGDDNSGARDQLSKALKQLCPDEIIHGGCSGADQLASNWADYYGLRNTSCPPTPEERKRFGPKACFVMRNQRMLDDHSPDLVLAVRGGRGTADMVRRALKAGVPVLRLEDGE